ncbi:flagellar motor switch protein FliN [Desulfogranum mediterraneum]|uniref:flagellar motor switch protein FliN n=1 Tax=Desulfogranum mediterraneum TaxID=160661 RepID=UPI0004198AC5|nr:flagellar motor switch protein FliN [Desulfogranum mediterraneum]
MATPEHPSSAAPNTLNPEETAELLEETPSRAAQQPSPGGQQRGLEFLFDVPLQVSVEVGRTKILLKDLLQMGEGYVVELDKHAGEPLDLYVNSRLIARGEAVKVGEKFGIKLTEVVSQLDRLEKLG